MYEAFLIHQKTTLVIKTSDELEDVIVVNDNCGYYCCLYLSQVQVVVVTIIFRKGNAAVFFVLQRSTVRNAPQYFTNRCRSRLPQSIVGE